MLKELLETLHNTESMKDKMLEADPNLEKFRAICQGRESNLMCFYKEKNFFNFLIEV